MKRFLVGMILSLCFFGSVSAQEVTVTGMGVDKDSAIRDATRLAVEQVVGAFIDSRTLMEDLRIQMDTVYKKSQGFVKRIQILSESHLNNSTYRVTAKIDVDTNPNSKLIDEITMLMRLNDPRITVIVFDAGQLRNESAEGILIDKLLSMNFSHVLHPSQVLKQNLDANGIFSGERDNSADYLVIGRCSRISNPIKATDYSTGIGTIIDSPLHLCQASFKIDVIKYDTGEYIGSFVTEGKGFGNNTDSANRAADNNALSVAAEKLSDTFKKFSAKTSNGLNFIITADSSAKFEEILNALRSIGTIDNIQIREQTSDKLVLSIETASRPYEVVSMLKSRTKLGVAVEKMSANECKLRII